MEEILDGPVLAELGPFNGLTITAKPPF